MLKIQVIMGSTRQGRFSEIPAKWIAQELKNEPDVTVKVLDLRDYPMPFFAEPVTPAVSKEPYKNEIVRRWSEKIAEGDGYVFITPEYNHGYPAVLKNALDYIYYPWNKKPAGFVSYGSVMGARSVEQLRQVMSQLQMVSIQAAVSIPPQIYTAAKEATDQDLQQIFSPLSTAAETMISQLLWWAKALKVARLAEQK